MVDKVETPIEAIKKEAELLQSMSHPNIVKFHGVYYERCFVCIVMDRYNGDLVEGLQRHTKELGPIPCTKIVHVAYQMGSSLDYLHKMLVVHRDVKGDNYLMDNPDMTDRTCQVVLTDFGTAIRIRQNERLGQSVGTKIFWAPEFFQKDYSFKVDVWAMGVIMYGLVSGCFPFRDQVDIANKEVRVPKRVQPVCEDFILRMLTKDEYKRQSAADVMSHEWLRKTNEELTHAAELDHRDEHQDGHKQIKEDNVNDGIKERRQELIARLQGEHDARTRKDKRPGKAKTYMAKTFALPDKVTAGGLLLFEWWSTDQAKQSGVLDMDDASDNLVSVVPQLSSEANDIYLFSEMLEAHNIDPSLFGKKKAKTLPQLSNEVRFGICRLMLDAAHHKKLVRVSDVVVLKLRSHKGGAEGGGPVRMLIETSEEYPDGRIRDMVRLPGTKKEPHENAIQTAERILSDTFHIGVNAVEFDIAHINRYEEEIESPSYPGVMTVYRKEIVDCVVHTNDQAQRARIGLHPTFATWTTKDKEGNKKTLKWMTEEMLSGQGVKLNNEGTEVSALVRAPIGYSEHDLREALIKSGVDVSLYGTNGAKTLKEFSTDLIRGEAALVFSKDGGLPCRIVDLVMLVITNPLTGQVLLQTGLQKPDGRQVALNRLPGAKKRPDENHFHCARRVLRRQLEMDEISVKLLRDAQQVEEEKPSPLYPGLRSIHRKRFVRCELVPPRA